MKNSTLIIILILGVAGAVWSKHVPYIGDRLSDNNEVIMYSLTTCGYCKQMAYKLDKSGIPYKELFIDRGETSGTDIEPYLTFNGPGTGVIGTPSFKVNGTMLLNNPPLHRITEHLNYK